MISKETWDQWCKEAEGMNPAEFVIWAKKTMGLSWLEPKQLNKNDMYQDRKEDLDPRVTHAINEGPKILKTLEDVQHMLRDLYYLKDGTNPLATVRFRPAYRKEDYYVVSDDLPKNWDYTKEFEESLEKLNKSVLDAYIVFLEAEREALITKWNNLAKTLK